MLKLAYFYFLRFDQLLVLGILSRIHRTLVALHLIELSLQFLNLALLNIHILEGSSVIRLQIV